jgi:phosphoserine phosphatase
MAANRDLLVITVTGRDRPGITAALSRILLESQVRILDVEQATLQDILALAFLVDLSSSPGSTQDMLKELLYQAKQMELTLDFRAFLPEEMVVRQSRDLYALTCISTLPLADVLARITPVLASLGINIVTIRCLAEARISGVEMMVDATRSGSHERFKQEILAAAGAMGIDLAIQRETVFRRNKRLLVFDMDRTLIAGHTLNELAALQGVGREVEALTDLALAGGMDYRESVRRRVMLLAGATREHLEHVAQKISVNDGVERLLKAVKRLGYRVALVSGGLDYFTSHVSERLGLDYAFGNQLEMRDGIATGRLVGEIIDADAKARILDDLAAREHIHPEQVVAIGDGANDVLMLSRAGLGIAYHAQPVVTERADARISAGALMSILYFLGITERDLAEIEKIPEAPRRAPGPR